jgi:tripartite-type tricarboxylate transporter receptor subunit TctC
MTFGTQGAGQMPYWNAMLFNNRAGINAVEIQYKAGLTVAVMSGEIDYLFSAASAVVTNQPRLRVLAATTAKRALQFPDVPTMHEAALPGYEMPGWASILGPAGMPRDIVASLNTAISRALAMPDVRDRFLKAGLEPLPGSPEEVQKKYSDWIVIFGKIAKDNGLKPH